MRPSAGESHADSQNESYTVFSRGEWSRLRGTTPLPLSEDDLAALRGLNDPVSLAEVADIYLPLAQLIRCFAATQRQQIAEAGGAHPASSIPYLLGIAGSVAVGKSTTARLLRVLLARGPGRPQVDLVTTDGFLCPNRILTQRGLMHRKGFPESYDLRRLVQFVADLKAGQPALAVPVYSHLAYDIVPGAAQVVQQPEILILEGLNILQHDTAGGADSPRVFVADFLDFSIYVDASEQHLQQWYVERFLRLRDTAFRDPASYFHRYASLSTEEAVQVATQIWNEINLANLRMNIAPTRERADLILVKGSDHAVQTVRLRRKYAALCEGIDLGGC